MKEKIWLSSPHMSGNEQKYVDEAFKTNWIAPLGPNVDKFEEELGNFLGINHVAVLSSGTAAIHLALILLGVKAEDEVLVSSFTFSATANPIAYVNATPVFIDSEKDTWNMCPELLEKAIIERISNNKKPKALILVHLYGMPAKIDQIASITNKYNIPLIEDAAEALGSSYKGKKLGTFGDLGILSFNGNKIITTSGGGALVANNQEYIQKAKFLATQARDEAPHYQHSHIGYNYRMSNVLAGIGRGQLEVIDDRVSRKREIFSLYFKAFKSIEAISFLKEPNNDFFSNYWLTSIVVNSDNPNKVDRETIRLALLEENIESRPLWKPMHLQPVFSKYPAYINGVSETLFNNGLCLPSGSNLTNEQITLVCSIISKLF